MKTVSAKLVKIMKIDKMLIGAKRWAELKALCNKYRRTDGYYDCIIPVSGGKDSHFLVHIIKEKMKMNPLLVCVTDPFTHTTPEKQILQP